MKKPADNGEERTELSETHEYRESGDVHVLAVHHVEPPDDDKVSQEQLRNRAVSQSSIGLTYERGAYVGDIQVVLRHVQPDKDACEVLDRIHHIAELDEALDEARQGERNVPGGENVSASAAINTFLYKHERRTTYRRISVVVVNLLTPSRRFW